MPRGDLSKRGDGLRGAVGVQEGGDEEGGGGVGDAGRDEDGGGGEVGVGEAGGHVVVEVGDLDEESAIPLERRPSFVLL